MTDAFLSTVLVLRSRGLSRRQIARQLEVTRHLVSRAIRRAWRPA